MLVELVKYRGRAYKCKNEKYVSIYLKNEFGII